MVWRECRRGGNIDDCKKKIKIYGVSETLVSLVLQQPVFNKWQISVCVLMIQFGSIEVDAAECRVWK